MQLVRFQPFRVDKQESNTTTIKTNIREKKDMNILSDAAYWTSPFIQNKIEVGDRNLLLAELV